jgi:hypothetical protein
VWLAHGTDSGWSRHSRFHSFGGVVASLFEDAWGHDVSLAGEVADAIGPESGCGADAVGHKVSGNQQNREEGAFFASITYDEAQNHPRRIDTSAVRSTASARWRAIYRFGNPSVGGVAG